MRIKSNLLFLVLSGIAALPLVSQDWPMWGGTAQRNMTSAMKDLPEFWDVKSGKNIKWKVQLGSTSYGNPVVADGKVFLGTNNENSKNPEIKGDKGVLMCFREPDGKFLWQAVTDKLDSGFENDWPEQGVCSSPAGLSIPRRRMPRVDFAGTGQMCLVIGSQDGMPCCPGN
jgi:outer membrane protein assembly factor BamB